MPTQKKKPPTVAPPGLFGRYAPEEESCSRKPDIKSYPKLDRLLAKWEKARELFSQKYFIDPLEDLETYEYFIPVFQLLLTDFKPSRRLVEDFAVRFSRNIGNEYALGGNFLNALMEVSTSSRFELNLASYEHPMIDLGAMAGRSRPISIKIHGDVEMFSFAKMHAGDAVIIGYADESLGFGMKGGTVRINGRIRHNESFEDDEPDFRMKLGHGMRGGEIHIFGDIDPRVNVAGDVGDGRIFHNGVKIAGK
jgi:hypothetical protein